MCKFAWTSSKLPPTLVHVLCERPATTLPTMKWSVTTKSLMRPLEAADTSPTSRQGFGRGNTKSSQNLKAAYNNGTSPTTQQPPMPPLVNSPSMSSTYTQENTYNEAEPKKFLQEKYAKCSVKGNFLTLAAQPKNVELGEWLAHQRQPHTHRVAGMS